MFEFDRLTVCAKIKFSLGNNMETVFPNAVITFRISLCLMISSCSGERSFSKLRIIKNQFRSCLIQPRLNSLTVLSLEHRIVRDIDLSTLRVSYNTEGGGGFPTQDNLSMITIAEINFIYGRIFGNDKNK